MEIKARIAKAIEDADNSRVPDGYAEEHGYPDENWLSDWNAFLADAVVREISRGEDDARELIARVIRTWIKDDLSVAGKMAITPEHVEKLVQRLSNEEG